MTGRSTASPSSTASTCRRTGGSPVASVGMMLRERTTARLRLRPVAMADLDDFVELETELRARQEPPRRPPDPADSARYLAAFVEHWERDGLGYWAALTADGAIAGYGGVQSKRRRGTACWNLYFRVRPALWGRGLATEIAREAVAVAALARPELPVLAETRPDNAGAIRVAERAGLVRQPDADGYAVLVRDPVT